MSEEIKTPRTADNFAPCECGESDHIYVKLLYRGRGREDVFIVECQHCGHIVSKEIDGFLKSEEAMPLLIKAWNESRDLALVTKERDELLDKLAALSLCDPDALSRAYKERDELRKKLDEAYELAACTCESIGDEAWLAAAKNKTAMEARDTNRIVEQCAVEIRALKTEGTA